MYIRSLEKYVKIDWECQGHLQNDFGREMPHTFAASIRLFRTSKGHSTLREPSPLVLTTCLCCELNPLI